MLTLRSIGQALGHLDPVLIDGIAAFVAFGLMAVLFIVTEHWLARQGPTTPLAWSWPCSSSRPCSPTAVSRRGR